MGIGLGILVGSMLKIFVNTNLGHNTNETKSIFVESNLKKGTSISDIGFKLNKSKKESKIISSRWKELSDQNPDIDVGGYFISLDSEEYAQLNPNKILPSASTIKIAILLITLEMIDNGELFWNEPIELKKELIGSGSGWMAYEQIGKHFPTHEIANEMIRISDNTAANLLIKRIGGINSINKRIKRIGLKDTQINNFLPDLKGTNTTTAKDMALIIAMIDSGMVLTPKSRDLFRGIMSTSVSNNLIPAGVLKGLRIKQEKIDYQLLSQGFKIYNKTGEIGNSYSDAGLIQMPDNTKAVASFIVKGPLNDPRSSQLIRDMASVIIEEIKPKSMLNPDDDPSL